MLAIVPPAATQSGPGVSVLNRLLLWEQSAVEAYTRALPEFDGHRLCAELTRHRREHEQAAHRIREQLRHLGAEPPADEPEGAGPAGSANQVQVLEGLLRVEEAGVAEYESAFQSEEITAECRFALRAEAAPRCHDHIDTLTAFLAQAGGR